MYSEYRKVDDNDDTPEQWKTLGNCNVCRRKTYCNHACAKHKRRMCALMYKSMREKLKDKRILDKIKEDIENE